MKGYSSYSRWPSSLLDAAKRFDADVCYGLTRSEACREVLRRVLVRKQLADDDEFEAVCSAAAITLRAFRAVHR